MFDVFIYYVIRKILRYMVFGKVLLIYLLNELAAAAAGLGDGPHCHGDRRIYIYHLLRLRGSVQYLYFKELQSI